MKVHERLDTFEVIKQHHEADAIGCSECFEDHCGKAHPERESAVIISSPEGCSICWLIRELTVRTTQRDDWKQSSEEWRDKFYEALRHGPMVGARPTDIENGSKDRG